MKDLVISKDTESGWSIVDELGVWPVDVKLQGNGWKVTDCYTDIPTRVTYEMEVESYGNIYVIEFDAENGNLEHVSLLDKAVSQLVIPRGHPAVKLFHKTGKGDSGREETISIDFSFNRQRYGVTVE